MTVYKVKTVSILFLLFSVVQSSGAMTSEVFDGVDSNALKAGISKYLLTKGAKIYHPDSYESNTFQATETVSNGRYSTTSYVYAFKLTPLQDGTRLDLTAVKSGSEVDSLMEEKLMNNIKTSLTGRFLYGLNFEFSEYDTPKGKIKAPKGKETGIKLTGVKYDALQKGLMAGDTIVAINNVDIKEIDIEDFATILFAKSINDSITLTYERNGLKNTVTLIPRASNRKVF